MAGDSSISIAVVGPVATAARTWRTESERFATLIAKVTLSLVPEGVMTLAAAEPVVTSEAHHRGNPMLSVRATAETAPVMGRADLLFAGSAYAPLGQPTAKLRVRWALMRGDAVLFDKSLEIVGDRSARPPELPGEPEPFTSLPIVYERAFGGIGVAANPVGVGAGPGPDGLLRLPNILAPPASAVVEPAGYAPLSVAWPARKRRLGSRSRRDLEIDDALIGADFDLAYFQAAPPDQQADYLQGDELVMMKHLHPELPMLMSRLPGLVCGGVASVAGAAPAPLRFVADTLFIDGDRAVCNVVFRARVPLPMGATLQAAIGVGVEGSAPQLPDPRELPLAPPREAAEGGGAGRFGTMLIETPEAPAPPVRWADTAEVGGSGPLTLPFARGGSPPRDRPAVAHGEPSKPASAIPGAPWSPDPAETPVSARKANASTLVLDPALGGEEEPPTTVVLDALPSSPRDVVAPPAASERPSPPASETRDALVPAPAPAEPPRAEPASAPPPPVEPPVPPPVPPPASPPRPALTPALYRKFGKG